MPFLEVSRRLTVCAVKGAGLAFTGAKRKPLTEEADVLGAGFSRKGSSERVRNAKQQRLGAMLKVRQYFNV
jgi:hypothetical protein